MSQLVSPAPRARGGGPVPASPVSPVRCHGQLLLPEMDGAERDAGPDPGAGSAGAEPGWVGRGDSARVGDTACCCLGAQDGSRCSQGACGPEHHGRGSLSTPVWGSLSTPVWGSLRRLEPG